MDAPRCRGRAATIVLETIMVLGWCAAMWLAMWLAIGEVRRAGIVRAYVDTGREFAVWVGIHNEPEVIIVTHPVPDGTPVA
jgi:hypothetical protein